MGLFSGSISVARFVVDPIDLEENRQEFFEKILEFSFKEDDTGTKEITKGWVCARDPFSESFNETDIFFGQYLILGLRIDKRSVPASVLKKFYIQKERLILEDSGKKALSKKEKKLLKERIFYELLKKTLAVPKVYELIWHLESGRVFFLATQIKAIELFEEMFKKTFGFSPRPMIPYQLALSLLDNEFHGNLKSINPEIFI